MKMGDGRIYVPLPFILKNFADAIWPVMMPADIWVNNQCIKEGFQVSVHEPGHGTRASRRHVSSR